MNQTIKQFRKYILATLAAAALSASAWGQMPSNTVMTSAHFETATVVTDKNAASWDGGIKLENNAFNWDERYAVIAIECTAQKIEFTTKQNNVLSSGTGFVVYEKDAGGSWREISTIGNSGTSNKNYSFNLRPTTRFVKLAWSSNFVGYYKNIKVIQNNIVVTPESVNVGEVQVGGSSADVSFRIDWRNVSPLNLILNNANDFALSSSNVSSSLCNVGNQTITVDFHPQTRGNKTCQVDLVDASNKTWKTITISGRAVGSEQQIEWWNETVTMISTEDEIPTPFVQASSGLPLTELYSTDESVLKVVDNQLVAVAPGTASIVAVQAGDDVTEPVRDTLTLEVTNLKSQRIVWDQSLMFKWGQIPVTLNATATSGLPITYEIVENPDNVVSLNHGVLLEISNIRSGDAIVRATQAGNEEYAATFVERKVRVRNPDATCLDEPLCLEYYNEREYSNSGNVSYNIVGPARTLTFDGTKNMLTAVGSTVVEQYVNGGWQTVTTISVSDFSKNDYKTFGPYNLNRNATQIRFRGSGSSYRRSFKNVFVTRAHYLESSTTQLEFAGQYNTSTTKNVSINYSNIQDVLNVSLETENDDFRLEPATFAGNECGEFGTQNVKVVYTPTAFGETSNALIISSEKDGTLRIPISTTVLKRNQNIPWLLRDSIATTQVFYLPQTITVSGLPIIYTFDDETIAKLDANNRLVFLMADTAFTITATCPGNENYNDATPIERRIKVFKGLCEIVRPTVSDTLTYGQLLGEANLIGGQARNSAGEPIEGDFAWMSRNTIPNASEHAFYPIVFVPYNPLYDTTKDSVAICVRRSPQTIVWQMPDSIGVMDSLTLDGYATSNLPLVYEVEGTAALFARVLSDYELLISATSMALDKELVIIAKQAGNENYLPADDVEMRMILRKTRANFFAASEPIVVPAGTKISLDDLKNRIHTGASVAGTWNFEVDSPSELHACIWTLKAVFTPANLDLCDPITVEIPINISEE